MHQQDSTVCSSGARGLVTVAEVLDRAMDQCMQRGLLDTATWLGQLALDASDSVMCQTLRANAPAVVAVQDPPLTGRAHRHHVVALGFMQKGEHLRCHHYLSNALREYSSSFPEGAPVPLQSTSAPVGTDEALGSVVEADGEVSMAGRERFSVRRGCGRSTPPPRRQPQHCAQLPLKKAGVSQAVPPQLQFLCLYSLYMAGECIKNTSSNPRKTVNPYLRMLHGLLLSALERQQQRHQVSQSSPTHTASTSTRCSPSLLSMSSRPSSKAGPRLTQAGHRSSPPSSPTSGVAAYGDPFLCWLHGVVLRDLGMKQESATYFLAAVCNHPMLWCVWEDLCTLVSRESQIEEIEVIIGSLEPRFMPEIFIASVKAALNVSPLSFVPQTATTTTGKRSTSPHLGGSTTSVQSATQEYGRRRPHSRRDTDGGSNSSASPRPVNSWEVLLEQFPKNLFLLSNLAGYYYNVKKDLETAHNIYKQIHESSPYRLESMDDYSIVLFLRSDRIGLSSLAQQVYHVDPFRAESNYVVGNYYVLMGAHDRAVLHFRRAVAADPTFIAAWTLLGHAYLETKNSAAAVEAYRAAIDLDQHDYRAWYNLGQIYELLQFYHHALYYYWHTTTLRPTDTRMWSAVANCLEHGGRIGEAMICLAHAERCENPKSDFYPPLVRRLGRHYLSVRKTQQAVTYFEKLLASDAKKLDDVLTAVPHVVAHYLRQAKQLLDVPARSPSCNPACHYAGNSLTSMTTTEGGVGANTAVFDVDASGAPLSLSVSGAHCVESYGSGPGARTGGSLADQWLTSDAAGRRSIDARWEQAGACLSVTEGHLESLASALGFPTLQAAVDSTVGRFPDYSVNGNDAALEDGRNRHVVQLVHHCREMRSLQYYLRDQQRQVDGVMCPGGRA